MLLSEFDFPFDPALVADHPVIPRDRARLLVLDRQAGGRLMHRQVADLPSLLQPGDLVVVNNTKVMPARVPAQVRPNVGAVRKDVHDLVATHERRRLHELA